MKTVSALAVGAIAAASPAHAQAVTESGAWLRYINTTPSALFGTGGEGLDFGATDVISNSGAGTTGVATTTNLSTGAPLTYTIYGDPSPVDRNNFSSYISICSLSCTPTGNNNPANLAGPWTLTFTNPGPPSSSASTNPPLYLSGSGEIPFVSSVTLSGTSAAPIFSWSAPPGPAVDGYRIDIWQNSLTSNPDGGLVVSANLLPSATTYTVQASDFTVPGYSMLNDTAYTIGILAIQTRDGTTNLVKSNNSAVSVAYSSFETLPVGTPSVNLPTTTLIGNQIIYGFNLTVQAGVTYYIDPEVATGYIYQTAPRNPNFASVELPNVGNRSPYGLFLWNGTSFVFDTMLAADTVFDFAGGGVSEFEVLGIDPSLGLDPTNPTAFITGLTFEGAGSFTGTMTPITTNIPEPSTWAMMLIGFAGLSFAGYRKVRVWRTALAPDH